MTSLALNVGTDDPAIVFTFPGLDLSGATIALKVAGGGTSESYENGDGLSVEVSGGDSIVTWTRTVRQSQKFGVRATFDLFSTSAGGAVSKLAAGTISFAGVGEIVGAAPVTVLVPGIQGPPGPSIYAEEWAQSPDPISVAAGGDGVNDRSSKWWAEASQAAQEVVDGIYDTVTAAPVSISDSTYTVTTADAGKVLEFTAACVVSFSNNLPAGAFGVLAREGSGDVSWSMLSGATSQTYPTGTKIAGQYASVTWRVHANADGTHAAYRLQGAIA